jgi:hypothetical protein
MERTSNGVITLSHHTETGDPDPELGVGENSLEDGISYRPGIDSSVRHFCVDSAFNHTCGLGVHENAPVRGQKQEGVR